MNDWFKDCVNRCMKSEVIALMRFCIVTWKSRSKVGQGPSSSNSSKAIVGCMTGSNCVHISA